MLNRRRRCRRAPWLLHLRGRRWRGIRAASRWRGWDGCRRLWDGWCGLRDGWRGLRDGRWYLRRAGRLRSSRNRGRGRCCLSRSGRSSRGRPRRGPWRGRTASTERRGPGRTAGRSRRRTVAPGLLRHGRWRRVAPGWTRRWSTRRHRRWRRRPAGWRGASAASRSRRSSAHRLATHHALGVGVLEHPAAFGARLHGSPTLAESARRLTFGPTSSPLRPDFGPTLLSWWPTRSPASVRREPRRPARARARARALTPPPAPAPCGRRR